jgi:hypothetical protein
VNRIAFTYMDLTRKPFLPMWLPQDSIGGKSILGSEWDNMSAGSHDGTLQQLGAALKAVSSQPRFFRSFTQWAAAFDKYVVAAVASKQLTWPAIMSYRSIIFELSEQMRIEGKDSFLAILYDDVLRKQLSHRAEQRDPSLNLGEAFKTLDKQVLEACKVRLDGVLKQVGVTSTGPSQHGGAQNLPRMPAQNQEEMVAKASAAAEALQRRVDAMQRSVQKQQDQVYANQRQWHPNPQAHQDGKGGKSRHEKRGAWVNNKMHEKQGKDGKKGKGKGKQW